MIRFIFNNGDHLECCENAVLLLMGNILAKAKDVKVGYQHIDGSTIIYKEVVHHRQHIGGILYNAN